MLINKDSFSQLLVLSDLAEFATVFQPENITCGIQFYSHSQCCELSQMKTVEKEDRKNRAI